MKIVTASLLIFLMGIYSSQLKAVCEDDMKKRYGTIYSYLQTALNNKYGHSAQQYLNQLEELYNDDEMEVHAENIHHSAKQMYGIDSDFFSRTQRKINTLKEQEDEQ